MISKPIEDAAVREIVLYALGVERWRDGLQAGARQGRRDGRKLAPATRAA